MGDGMSIISGQEALGRLCRAGSQEGREILVVASPGARAAAWTIKIKSHSSYNIYNVRTVVIGDAGSLPVEIGAQKQAVNLAESFLEQGQLSAGAFAVMFKVGDKNVFYTPV